MNHDILILICAYDNDGNQKLKDYGFWKSLVNKLDSLSTEFEIRCWSDEPYAIETGKIFGQSIINTETQELVFKEEATEHFIKEISENYLTPLETLKWFTLNFYNQGKLICHCGHYGSEICFMGVSDEEISAIYKWAENFTEISRIDVF